MNKYTEAPSDTQEVAGAIQNTPYKKWYAENKEAHNEKRKTLYQTNKSYRDEVKRRQATYRKRRPKTPTVTQQKYASIDGEQTEIFRIGYVSKEIGKSVQVIAAWESRGLIPVPSVDSYQRYYTKHQIELLRAFSLVVDAHKYSRAESLSSELIEASKTLQLNWR